MPAAGIQVDLGRHEAGEAQPSVLDLRREQAWAAVASLHSASNFCWLTLS